MDRAQPSKFAANADIVLHEVIDLAAIEAGISGRTDGTNSLPGQVEALMTHMREDHTTAEEIGRIAHLAGVGKVVLTHLVGGTRAEDEAGYAEGVWKHYAGPVVVARDLMEL